MNLLLPRHCYVTGTDTGIGKTHVSAWILRNAVMEGRRAIGMKPVASGCTWRDGEWRSEDAEALIAASNVEAAYADINPYALELPLAPELAARDAGVTIDPINILSAYYRLMQHADSVVVEGVGGWLAPLMPMFEQSELVRSLNLPVVMVVGLRLGCVHQARATARAIVADGCELVGWIGNSIDPAMSHRDDNIAILDRVLPVPRLAVLEWAADASSPHKEKARPKPGSPQQ